MRLKLPAGRPTRDDLVFGSRLFVNTVRILRTPIDPADVRARLHERLEHRGQHFLDLAGATVFANARSPYRRLLEAAGCSYGDLERLIHREGLEAALQELFRQGVYLTVDELKGRQPVVRGSLRFTVDAQQLLNPRVVADMVAQSSGRSGAPIALPTELATVRDSIYPGLKTGGGLHYAQAIAVVPGTGALRALIITALEGSPPGRWFCPVDLTTAGLHPRYAWSARAVRWAGRLAGVNLPGPEFVPLSDPEPIVRWMVDALRAGKRPRLYSYVSLAVAACALAYERGLDLSGTDLHITGEPTTPARLAALQRVGARAHTRYSSTEAGNIARGCEAPRFADEAHFFHDSLALIQPGPDSTATNLPPDALLLTSLRPRAKLILLNVSTGDQAEVTQRACGCPLEEHGWSTHLHAIRSFEKLTAGGMTFHDADMAHVLEETLPGRFGGGPLDYQLVDEVQADGSPGVRLRVHPRIGTLDPELVRRAFLDAIGEGAGMERVMELVWRDAGLPVVERCPPLVTPGGKVQPVHHLAS